jgi:integrase
MSPVRATGSTQGRLGGIVLPAKKITKKTVDASSQDGIAKLIRDTEVKGFLLSVTKTGNKSYVVEYRTGNGRGAPKRRYTIGRHGSPWTPEQARIEAKRLLSLVAAGSDPLTARYAPNGAMKLEELCGLYLEEGTNHKKSSTLRGDRSRIRHYLIPMLGKRAVVDIARADVERLVRDVSNMPHQIRNRRKGDHHAVVGGRGAASQCVAVLGAIFSFAIERGICSTNPARGVKKPPTRIMERFLNGVEIGRLAAATQSEALRTENPFPSAAIRLLLLTGCRKSEILDLRWKDVDFDNNCLRLKDSKTGAKVIYLNAESLSVLQGLPRLSNNLFVIAGLNTGGRCGGLDTVWARVRKAANLDDVRLHDLRHSFASIAVRNGMSLPIIGALLGHKHTSTTMRYAHLAAEPLRLAASMIGSKISEAISNANGLKADADT